MKSRIRKNKTNSKIPLHGISYDKSKTNSKSTKADSHNKTCPNCGHKSLKRFMDMWICHECEYHSKHLRKRAGGSFR